VHAHATTARQESTPVAARGKISNEEEGKKKYSMLFTEARKKKRPSRQSTFIMLFAIASLQIWVLARFRVWPRK
jgi:hypothetical protein